MAADPQRVTDQEIQHIIDQGEAGVGTLMAAFESVEQNYFSAVAPLSTTTTYSTNTSTVVPQ